MRHDGENCNQNGHLEKLVSVFCSSSSYVCVQTGTSNSWELILAISGEFHIVIYQQNARDYFN